MSFDALCERMRRTKSQVAVGLDPRLEYVPRQIIDAARNQYGRTYEAAGAALLEFNRSIIEACAGLAPAVKLQSAYYELYGLPGLSALRESIELAREAGYYVIVDAKRGDIGATCDAYAGAYLGGSDILGIPQPAPFGADCLTVNPYLGGDGVAPFTEQCKRHGKAIFCLVKTSNPSSAELQDLPMRDGAPLYRHAAELARRWGDECGTGACGYTPVGAVVGATYPAQLAELRAALPRTFFLIPGYGAQGGKAADAALGFDKDGLGAVVNNSRALMCAYKAHGEAGELDYKSHIRGAARAMRDELAQATNL